MADKTLVEPTKGSVAAFAPGRIEFLGNHLDYNGGLVLGAAIDSGIYALAIRARITSSNSLAKVFRMRS